MENQAQAILDKRSASNVRMEEGGASRCSQPAI
jgi:hypothetical protein